MKLTSAKIQNYRSVEDSGEFGIGPVTCLVGKNEAGKTNILMSLYRLNPVVKEEAKFDEMEYPRRRWLEYKEKKKDEPDTVLTTKWQLEAKEIAAVESLLGPDCLSSASIRINKGYDNTLRWTIPIDEPRVVGNLLKEEGVTGDDLTGLAKETTIEGLLNSLKSIQNPSATVAKLIKTLQERFKKGGPTEAAKDVLGRFLPTLLYFAEYQRMVGRVAIDSLLAKRGQKALNFSERVFLALLDLAGTSAEELRNVGKLERLIADLEAVSNRISKEIFAYWSQNKHLHVEFRVDAARPQDPEPFNSGYVFQARIENRRHEMTVGFDERSSGFVWFFSFLVWFSQIRKTYGENLIILLDEPGLGLHARAQSDLLRYINEKLRPHHQVIYTTHSPFMVDLDNLPNIRTVEDSVVDDKVEGTKISENVLGIDPDTLFPLQAALGYGITQTLFVGDHTFLVEGPSDLLYLRWFSKELEKKVGVGLDRRWVIAPVGGMDKLASFVALFSGNKVHVAVLTDFHKGEKRKIQALRDSDLVKKGHVFTPDMYTGQEEADLEDMIGRETYIALVNATYGLSGENALPMERPKNAPERVIEEVIAHFALFPEKGPFNHYRPAEFLVLKSEGPRTSLPGIDQALSRFEGLFVDLNQLLPIRKGK